MKETWEFAHKHLGKLRFRCGLATIIPSMIPMFLIMGKDTDIIKNILAVGTGSFIGGTARYLVSLGFKSVGKCFPWGTSAVNLLGCLMIGLLWGLLSRNATEGSYWGLFLTVGLCGGFTTFSTFSKEAFTMLQAGNIWGSAAYVALSMIGGIALVALGYHLAR